MPDWDELVSHAAGLLLGRPLSEFDPAATYAVFSYDDETAGDVLGELDPETLVAEESGRSGDRGGQWPDWSRWVPDLARSAFVLTQVRPAALEPVLTGATADGRAMVWGADLGRALLDGAVHLDELTADGYRHYPHLLLRPRTDGSLLDAMRAATWTMSAPDGLCDIEEYLVEHGYLAPGASAVDPRWAPALDQVGDDALRRHLRGLCLDARWSRSIGAAYLGPGECPNDFRPLADLPGSTVLAGWESGEGQGSVVVIALSEPGGR